MSPLCSCHSRCFWQRLLLCTRASLTHRYVSFYLMSPHGLPESLCHRYPSQKRRRVFVTYGVVSCRICVSLHYFLGHRCSWGWSLGITAHVWRDHLVSPPHLSCCRPIAPIVAAYSSKACSFSSLEAVGWLKMSLVTLTMARKLSMFPIL